MDNRILTCVYCGKEYPVNTSPWGPNNQILTDHIKICAVHPMRKLEEENAKLRADLETKNDSIPSLIFRKIFNELCGRKGFDHFWHDIDSETQTDITKTCEDIIRRYS